MAISSVGASNSVATNQVGNVSIEEFLKILTQQLNSQDPLKPVDNQEFVAQIAQFAALEQSRQVNVKIDQLLAGEAANQAIGLLGREVTASVNGQDIVGIVSAIDLAKGTPLISIKVGADTVANDINLSQLKLIRKGN